MIVFNPNVKYLDYNFEKLFKSKGYAWFNTGNYNLNIIGIRSSQNNKITNMFDDNLIVDYIANGVHKRIGCPITTEPGLFYSKNLLNKKGVSILVPGQYRGCWAIGLHQGKYKALCQIKPVKVYRDNNKDDIYDCNPETIDNGIFGINIHRANPNKRTTEINKYSAGCQVFADPKDFNSFMALCEKQKVLYGNSFTYTLINEEDLK